MSDFPIEIVPGGDADTDFGEVTVRPSRTAWQATRHLVRMCACIRFDEVLFLQGTPLFGLLFAVGRLTFENIVAISILISGSCCLVAHVFVINDWAGTQGDLRNPHRKARLFITKGVDPSEIYNLGIALLAIALVLIAPFGLRTLLIALGIAGASALYSAPAFHMKGVPFLNSALHFIGGVLHFLLGYSLFSAIDVRGLAIASFFALIFMAGHLTHEARDQDSDMLNGIRTNAVRFGRARSFVAGLIFFTISNALLVVLDSKGLVTRPLVFIAALYPLHLYWSIRTLKAGLTFESIRSLQVRYRALYAIIGLTTAATVLLTHWESTAPR